MDPRLIVIAGPLEGTIFPLNEVEISIGRERSNQFWINDIAVSRRHSMIKREGDQFKLSDLGSSNGTRVNGVPIKERQLDHGDLIALGDSLFLFLMHEESDSAPALSSVEMDEAGLDSESTILLKIDEALYLNPEKVLAALPPSARLAHDLNALLKISSAVNSIRDLEALQQQLLKLIFEVIPAQRGAILLVKEGQKDFESVFGWDRLTGADLPVQVSHTIVNKVLAEGVAVLSSDLADSEAFNVAESLRASQTRSLLAVPLAVFTKISGVLYLDTSEVAARFDESHLQLATAIASIAAVAIANARNVESLEDEKRQLQEDIRIEHNMVGESRRMREIYQAISKVAPTDSTVLILGESGTGKEMAARAIHQNSARAARLFVAINCAALTETLLESELFGHEKGAFTGAIAQKRGRLELADGGTVFLDEVGELAPALQAKLLRVLQEREFERVGGLRAIKVDIRLIAATNRDIEEAIRSRAFRQDLYYRLNVVRLVMPSLKDRREDIPLLASYFTVKYSHICKRRVKGISTEARACLMSYDWPGNVRELENAIERAVVLGSTETILPEDLPETLLETTPPADSTAASYYEAVKEAKKQIILKALDQAGSNYVEAAKLLGIHPNNLHRLIRNLNVKPILKS
jgi:Nif-specific regulatory protein